MKKLLEGRMGRFLRKVKSRLEPKDGSVGYQRRLKRELTRVTRSFFGGGRPVLIHTYGKVGSTAIHTAITKLPGFQSFQTHFISAEGVEEARRIHKEHERDPIHLKLGERLREEMAAHPGKEIRVITLVRDPVARAVSDLFENPALLIGESDLRKVPMDRLIEIAAKQVLSSLDYTERWFDRELSGVLGFDFFAYPFDRVVGFQIHEHGRVKLLSGKLELLSGNGGKLLGAFLGLGGELVIPKRRSRGATGEASLYDQVRKSLKLPAEVLDKVYGSRVCRHFYTPEEIEGFRSIWQA